MNVARYVNGIPVEQKDLKNYILDNELILKTIQAVNERIKKNFPKSQCMKK